MMFSEGFLNNCQNRLWIHLPWFWQGIRTGDVPGVWRRANGLPISCKLADWTTWSSCMWNVIPIKFSSQIFIPRLLGSQCATKKNNGRFLFNTEKERLHKQKQAPQASFGLSTWLYSCYLWSLRFSGIFLSHFQRIFLYLFELICEPQLCFQHRINLERFKNINVWKDTNIKDRFWPSPKSKKSKCLQFLNEKYGKHYYYYYCQFSNL